LKINSVDAVATANLFNFLGDALPKSRIKIINEKIDLAVFSSINNLKV
jgi:imidazole glycerol-phosphate synthase subunit HisF